MSPREHVRLVEVHDGPDGTSRWVDVVERPGATSSCVHHHATREEACACGRSRSRAAQLGHGRRVLLGRHRTGALHR
ncbi:hypothetical protein [Vallicoccus soli]|uniref:DUF2188 domain-containing protein n=1 Tax=Vallicoccus soli TaxID=2339232 RepID=A0A3A3ZGH0_9ACTN|nr:hypothetical protein [Vallicoccus soli]RJK94316.1 hypothetical protein D5H78_15165 [Vallicoccus soli]